METVLIVLVSTRMHEAPTYTYLGERWTIVELFQSLTGESIVRGQSGASITTIEATFLWDSRRRQLLRKDNADDWKIFLGALQRAWRQKRAFFLANGCEIEMIVYVEEGA